MVEIIAFLKGYFKIKFHARINYQNSLTISFFTVVSEHLIKNEYNNNVYQNIWVYIMFYNYFFRSMI